MKILPSWGEMWAFRLPVHPPLKCLLAEKSSSESMERAVFEEYHKILSDVRQTHDQEIFNLVKWFGCAPRFLCSFFREYSQSTAEVRHLFIHSWGSPVPSINAANARKLSALRRIANEEFRRRIRIIRRGQKLSCCSNRRIAWSGSP